MGALDTIKNAGGKVADAYNYIVAAGNGAYGPVASFLGIGQVTIDTSIETQARALAMLANGLDASKTTAEITKVQDAFKSTYATYSFWWGLFGLTPGVNAQPPSVLKMDQHTYDIFKKLNAAMQEAFNELGKLIEKKLNTSRGRLSPSITKPVRWLGASDTADIMVATGYGLGAAGAFKLSTSGGMSAAALNPAAAAAISQVADIAPPVFTNEEAEKLLKSLGVATSGLNLKPGVDFNQFFDTFLQGAMPKMPGVTGVVSSLSDLTGKLSSEAQQAYKDYSKDIVNAYDGYKALREGDYMGAAKSAWALANDTGLVDAAGKALNIGGVGSALAPLAAAAPFVSLAAGVIFSGLFGASAEEAAAQARQDAINKRYAATWSIFYDKKDTALKNLAQSEDSIALTTKYAAASVYAAIHGLTKDSQGRPIPAPMPNVDDWGKKPGDDYVQLAQNIAFELLNKAKGLSDFANNQSWFLPSAANAYNSAHVKSFSAAQAAERGMDYFQLIKFKASEEIYNRVLSVDADGFNKVWNRLFGRLTKEQYRYKETPNKDFWWSNMPSSQFGKFTINSAPDPSTKSSVECFVPEEENKSSVFRFVGGYDALLQSYIPASDRILWVRPGSWGALHSVNRAPTLLAYTKCLIDNPRGGAYPDRASISGNQIFTSSPEEYCSRTVPNMRDRIRDTAGFTPGDLKLDGGRPPTDDSTNYGAIFDKIAQEKGSAKVSEAVFGYNNSGTRPNEFGDSVQQQVDLVWKHRVMAPITGHLQQYRLSMADMLHRFALDTAKLKLAKDVNLKILSNTTDGSGSAPAKSSFSTPAVLLTLAAIGGGAYYWFGVRKK